MLSRVRHSASKSGRAGRAGLYGRRSFQHHRHDAPFLLGDPVITHGSGGRLTEADPARCRAPVPRASHAQAAQDQLRRPPSKSSSMPGRDHSAAYAGSWNRPVASNTARAASPTGPSASEDALGPAVVDDPGQLPGQVGRCAGRPRALFSPASTGTWRTAPGRRPPCGAWPRRGRSSQRSGARRPGRRRPRSTAEPLVVRSSQRLRDRLAQRGLRGEVPVDAAVADAERAGHVDHGGLGRAVAAQHVLGGFEDALGGQGLAGAAGMASRTVCRSAARCRGAPSGRPGSARRRPHRPARRSSMAARSAASSVTSRAPSASASRSRRAGADQRHDVLAAGRAPRRWRSGRR